MENTTTAGSEPKPRILIEFLNPWAHPTREEIYGIGDRAMVRQSIAELLIRDGYARRVQL